MGKNSKNKSKKSAKKERVAHLKHVEECENSFSLLEQKIDSLELSRNREVCMIYNQHIKLTLQNREAYEALSKYKIFRQRLSKSYAGLLVRQILCQNYIEALESLTNLLKIPLLETSLKNSVEPWRDIFLLRLEGTNNDRVHRLILNTEEIIDSDIAKLNDNSLKNLFVPHALFELSRLQLFEAVQYLSMNFGNKMKEVPHKDKYINLDRLGKMFFVYSTTELFRHDLVRDDNVPLMLDIMGNLFTSPMTFDIPCTTGYLAAFLHKSYLFSCNQEELSPDKVNEVKDHCTKVMEVYLDYKSSSLNMICYTCDDEDTKDHEVFVCQGCRVACYCCKGHQRLNYLHHEDTGTRGLGHKHLCPVYKAFRKKRDNTDSSKDGHLERKFQRACMIFFLNTFKFIGKRKVAVIVGTKSL